ncbi:MAG TPA: MerR family transcriptional regulator [Acidimicrobiales bacterium]
MSSRTHLSIGDVLSLLREEFPDVTISKIRFLESQGLVNPERSPSGYRKFYDHDVERLRWVLRQQREHFLPLKVIRDRLVDSGGALPADDQPPVEQPDRPASPVHAVAPAAEPVGEGSSDRGRPANGSGELPVPNLRAVPEPTEAGTEAGLVHRLHPAGTATPTSGPGPASFAPSVSSDAVPEAAVTRFGAHAAAPVPDRVDATTGDGDAFGDRAAPDPRAGRPAGSTVRPEAESSSPERPTAPPAGAPAAEASEPDGSPGDTDGGSTSGSSSGGAGPSSAGMASGGIAEGGSGGRDPARVGAASGGAPGEPAGGSSLVGSERPAGDVASPTGANSGPGGASPGDAGSPPPSPAAPPAQGSPREGVTEGAAGGTAARRPSSSSGPSEAGAPGPSAGMPEPEEIARALSFDVTQGVSGVSLTIEELCGATGLSAAEIATLEGFGLIEPLSVAGGRYYDECALAVAHLVSRFGRYGVEPRHLRLYRNAVDRESGLVEQIVTPLLRQRNPESRQRANAAAADLGALGQQLRAALLRRELRRLLGG